MRGVRLRFPIGPARWLGAVTLALAASSGPSARQGGQVAFTDVTAPAGIRFTHHNGAAGDHWYPELFGGGVAALDVDQDRWPDVLFVDGRDWAPGGRPARHRLYRNDQDGTFSDITANSGFDALDVYGLGASVGDYDNDGRDDVFVTTVDGGRLLRNTGGRFADVTARLGIANRGFAVSAAWLDYDRDGGLDLLVGNYVQWSPPLEGRCTLGGVQGYCGPDAYKPAAPVLYRNRGDRFEDVTARVGLDEPVDKAMGIAVLDYDRDLWPDVFIGSDRVPARLLHNEGGRTFVDVGLTAGVALSEMGAARANMGVDAADYDRSGWPDLLVGNFVNEMLGLYRNDKGRSFTDAAPRSAVGRASLPYVTWGVFFFDHDLDGWLDIFAANGGTDESQGRDARARVSQPPLLLRNLGDGTFQDVSPALGPAFTRPIMGRGAAYLDFDGDGDLDVAIGTLAGPAVLLRNEGATAHRWLRVRTAGGRSNRGGIGAEVTVTSASGTQSQTVRSGSSYASQSELPLTFGLAFDRTVTSIEVRWPSGTRQTFTNVVPDQQVLVDEAEGLILNDRASPLPGARAPLR